MTTISTKWTPKKRDYVSEHKQLNKTTTVTTTHPLGVIVVCVFQIKYLIDLIFKYFRQTNRKQQQQQHHRLIHFHY
jgi:hypothetical protein